MRWQSVLVAGLLSQSSMAKDYVIGDQLTQLYPLNNDTATPTIQVWFNFIGDDDASCSNTSNSDNCWYMTTQNDTGMIDFQPSYGDDMTTSQLFKVPSTESGTDGFLEIFYLDENGNFSDSDILSDFDYTFFQPILFPDNFDLNMRAYECSAGFDDLTVRVYSNLLSVTSSFTLALVTLTNDGLNWESEVEMSAQYTAPGNEVPYKTVELTGATLPSDDCPSGAAGLILNVAVGSPSEEFEYYNVWSAGDADVVMVYQEGDFASTIGSSTLDSFDSATVSVSEGEMTPPIMIVLSPVDASFYGSDGTTEMYILGCEPPYSPSDYSTFGWFAWMLESNATNFEYATVVVPAGVYTYNTYYYPFEASAEDLEYFASDMTYQMYLINAPSNDYNGTISIVRNDENAFVIEDSEASDGDLKRGDSTTFSVTTSLNGSNSIMYEYLKSDGSECGSGNFLYEGETTEWVTSVPDACDKDSVTLKLWAEACGQSGDNSYQSSMQYDLKKSSGGGGNGGLSVGAIIGIVCASVLVVGLAAWWVLMRKSDGSSGGYSSMD